MVRIGLQFGLLALLHRATTGVVAVPSNRAHEIRGNYSLEDKAA